MGPCQLAALAAQFPGVWQPTVMRRISGWMIAIAFFFTTACSSDDDDEKDVGKPCTPADENDPTFAGFSEQEVSVATGATDCETGVCLVNHFRGRVSCPYGQSADDIELSCLVPGTSMPVLVPVEPQDSTRSGDVAATCSCRCAGPGPGPFCSCASGTECIPVVDNLGLPGSTEVAGSYCIVPGAKWDTFQGPDCDPRILNCGPR
jgi:hypothetical protein